MVWLDRTAVHFKGQPYYDISVRELAPFELPPKTRMQTIIRTLYPQRPRVIGYVRVPIIWR